MMELEVESNGIEQWDYEYLFFFMFFLIPQVYSDKLGPDPE